MPFTPLSNHRQLNKIRLVASIPYQWLKIVIHNHGEQEYTLYRFYVLHKSHTINRTVLPNHTERSPYSYCGTVRDHKGNLESVSPTSQGRSFLWTMGAWGEIYIKSCHISSIWYTQTEPMYVYECNFAITLQNLSAQFNLRLTSHHDETKSVELVVTPQSLGRSLQDLRPGT